jgi:hypothetical protein
VSHATSLRRAAFTCAIGKFVKTDRRPGTNAVQDGRHHHRPRQALEASTRRADVVRTSLSQLGNTTVTLSRPAPCSSLRPPAPVMP